MPSGAGAWGEESIQGANIAPKDAAGQKNLIFDIRLTCTRNEIYVDSQLKEKSKYFE